LADQGERGLEGEEVSEMNRGHNDLLQAAYRGLERDAARISMAIAIVALAVAAALALGWI
jgi:hypothetical protein